MASKQSEPKLAKFLVESPVENFVGVGAGGVQFAYGRAEVYEGWVLNWYREKGFKVTKIEENEAPAKGNTGKAKPTKEETDEVEGDEHV